MKITIKNKKIKKISAIIFDKVINSLTPNFVAPTPDKKVKEKVLPIVCPFLLPKMEQHK